MEKTEPEDLLFQMRRKAVDKLMEDFPTLGEFSPEQYGEEGRSMGSVYVPDFKRLSKFTNLKSRHVGALFDAFWMAEVQSAAHDGRFLDLEKILSYFEVELGDINGWRANMYNRTGMEALRASPILSSKPSWRERRAMKKQGGW